MIFVRLYTPYRTSLQEEYVPQSHYFTSRRLGMPSAFTRSHAICYFFLCALKEQLYANRLQTIDALKVANRAEMARMEWLFFSFPLHSAIWYICLRSSRSREVHRYTLHTSRPRSFIHSFNMKLTSEPTVDGLVLAKGYFL